MPSGAPQPNRPRPRTQQGGGIDALMRRELAARNRGPSRPTSQLAVRDTRNRRPVAGRRVAAGMNDIFTGQDADREAGSLFPIPDDPYGGMTPEQAVAALLGDAMNFQDGGGGGRGRGGGGGGGGGSAIDPNVTDAYRNLLGTISDGSANFGATETALRAAQSEGANRLTGIVSDLTARSNESAARRAAAYGRGDAALAGLQSDYASRYGDLQRGAQNFAGAFGGSAGPVGNGAGDLLTALRGMTSTTATADAVSDADRQSIYGGYAADTARTQSSQFDALLAKLQAQRLAAAQAAEAQRAQLRLQAASAGVTL